MSYRGAEEIRHAEHQRREIDRLNGEGFQSQHGYISAFDLYTYLYEAVGATVKQQIPEHLRQRYGETQEPELAVLKGNLGEAGCPLGASPNPTIA